MPRARDELDAETLDVVVRVAQRMDFELAAVAGAGVDLTDGVSARPSVRRMFSCNRAATTMLSSGSGDGSVLIPVFAIWRRMWSIRGPARCRRD